MKQRIVAIFVLLALVLTALCACKPKPQKFSTYSMDYFDTVITITKAGTTVKASQLMKLMGLGVKQGDVVTVTAEGASEDAALAAMKEFFQNNL